MTQPVCPQCGVLMVQRAARATGQPFWGCTRYPRCKGTLPLEVSGSQPETRHQRPEPRHQRPEPELATLHATLRQVTRERDTFRAGYEQLLGEVLQLRRRAPVTTAAALVRELTRLLSVVHPDKWGGESAVATALTQEVLRLRTRVQEGR